MCVVLMLRVVVKKEQKPVVRQSHLVSFTNLRKRDDAFYYYLLHLIITMGPWRLLLPLSSIDNAVGGPHHY